MNSIRDFDLGLIRAAVNENLGKENILRLLDLIQKTQDPVVPTRPVQPADNPYPFLDWAMISYGISYSEWKAKQDFIRHQFRTWEENHTLRIAAIRDVFDVTYEEGKAISEAFNYGIPLRQVIFDLLNRLDLSKLK